MALKIPDDVFGMQLTLWIKFFCHCDSIQSPANDVAQLAADFRFVARRQSLQAKIRYCAREVGFQLIE
jgi:hypothetical protein